MHIQIAERTHIGNRQNNEDARVAARLSINGQELTLLGVFDGVGGLADGEVASRIAADTLLSLAPQIAAKLPPATGDTAQHAAEELAKQWRGKAAWSLHSAVQDENKHASMATTTVAAALLGDTLAIWWLGDSRAYLFREGKLRQLTTDHSTISALNLSEEAALEHPHRNQITRFLRATANDEPDVVVEEWCDGDVVLLVSDGVSGSLTSWELETFLAYWLVSDISAGALADNLLRHIKDNLSDNASIAIAIRGVPQPMGREFPQVPLASLLCYGLAPDVLQALTTYPADSAEWRSREKPPWRELDASKDGLLNPGQPSPQADSASAICPVCHTWITPAGNCAAHPDTAPFIGTVVEMISSDGTRQMFTPAGPLTLTPAGETLRDANGDLPDHEIALQLLPREGEVPTLRIRSPLGAQLQTHDIEILKPWPSAGLSFTVQNTLVVIRQTASGPLHDAPRKQPAQVRQPHDQETTLAVPGDSAATAGPTENSGVVASPSPELTEDAPTLPEPAAKQTPADTAD